MCDKIIEHSIYITIGMYHRGNISSEFSSYSEAFTSESPEEINTNKVNEMRIIFFIFVANYILCKFQYSSNDSSFYLINLSSMLPEDISIALPDCSFHVIQFSVDM